MRIAQKTSFICIWNNSNNRNIKQVKNKKILPAEVICM